MAETYEEIVRKWYLKLRDNFTGMLMDRYGKTDMRLADAENIYQDIFIAIHQNLKEGRIGANWNWNNYIMRVGLNMASKRYRIISKEDTIDESDPEDGDMLSARARKTYLDMLEKLEAANHKSDLFDEDSRALLGEELTRTPEPCATIIRNTYYSDMSDAEIAESMAPYRDNGKPVEVNAKAVKARRWLCMRDLIYRVKLAFYNAGITDVKPTKKKSNGKNRK